MILDSSALISILRHEPEAPLVAAALRGAARVGIGAPMILESSVVATSRFGPAGAVALDDLLAEIGIEIVAFDSRHWRVARAAHARYGRGHHPARLNLGDCFSYATARVAGRPLLCVGDDFPQTDLELVPLA